MKNKLILLLFALFPMAVFASNPARFDLPVVTTTPAQVPVGSLPDLLAVTNATIAVCGYPATANGATLHNGDATMCTNTITAYTDGTLGTACPPTAQLTANGTSVCISTTGLQGAFGFWYDAAVQTHMTYTMQTSWGTFGPYDISPGSVAGGGNGTVTNFTAGDLSPLFTSSVANATTTPALTFTPSTFAAHSFYGNNGASTATPGASLIGTSDWSPNAYVVGSGSAQAQTITLSPAATALTAGLEVRWLPVAANTAAAPTLNVNGLGARSITKFGANDLAAGDLTTQAVAYAIYDGSRFQLQNPQTATGGIPTGAVLLNPPGSQTIERDFNGPNELTVLNSDPGASALSAFSLSNGTGVFDFFIDGTGAANPGSGAIATSTSGAQFAFETNNGNIKFQSKNGASNPTLLLDPSNNTTVGGNLVVDSVSTTPSSLPICPNGTGGAFTTAGCSGGSGGLPGGTGVVAVNSGTGALATSAQIATGLSSTPQPVSVSSLNNVHYANQWCTTPGTLDDTCISNAIADIVANGPVAPGSGLPMGSIIVPPGVYTINNTITFPTTAHITMIGQYEGTFAGAVFKYGATPVLMIQDNGTGTVISHISFFGNGTSTGSPGTINAIAMGTSSITAQDNHINWNWFRGLYAGIHIVNANGLDMSHNTSDAFSRYLIYTNQAAGDVLMTDTVGNSLRCFAAVNNCISLTGNNTISFAINQFQGIFDNGTNASGAYLSFTNMLQTSVQGQFFNNAGGDISVSGGTAYNFGPAQYYNSGTTSISITSGANVQIHNSTFLNSAIGKTSNTVPMINVVTSSNVLVHDNTSTILSGGVGNANYGLASDSPTTGIIAYANNFNAQVTGAYNILGSAASNTPVFNGGVVVSGTGNPAAANTAALIQNVGSNYFELEGFGANTSTVPDFWAVGRNSTESINDVYIRCIYTTGCLFADPATFSSTVKSLSYTAQGAAPNPAGASMAVMLYSGGAEIEGFGASSGAVAGFSAYGHSSDFSLNDTYINCVYNTGCTFADPVILDQSISMIAQTAATSGTAVNSPFSKWLGNYWTGSVSAADTWTCNVQFNTSGGFTNPESDLVCGGSGSSGAHVFKLTTASIANLTGTVINDFNTAGSNAIGVFSSVSATSGANQSSPYIGVSGSYWDGSLGRNDTYIWQNVIGAGTNPATTMTLIHSGSTGGSTGPDSMDLTTVNFVKVASLLATGIVDGTTPVTTTTTTPVTLGSTYHSGYTFNNDGATAVTYTLPTAAAGLQYCVANYTGATGTLKVATSATGQFIDNAGANTATGGYVISGGALGDAGCFIGMSATNWKLYVQSGTWTTH